ncbi:MAG: preprotein translocase subunit SecE [Candidatus Paceibacterota bacterium]
MSIATYISETKGELKHVSWATRRQAVNFTLLVILISLVTSIFLFLFDTLFIYLLTRFVF